MSEADPRRALLADALAHDARNALNTVSLAVQLVERLIGREPVGEAARTQLARHLGTAGAEVEKVRGAVERLSALARGEGEGEGTAAAGAAIPGGA